GRIIRELSAHSTLSVIGVEEDALSTALRIREAVQRGELVAILADRRAAEQGRNVTVDFLGSPAPFPSGPYLVAHTLKCPVYLVFGLFFAPNRYEMYCEPFADTVRLDRGRREASIREYAQRYANRLAEHARSAPFNWFNFYDFWRE